MVLQGLVILVVGLSMVVSFLSLLILVMTIAGKIIPRFNHWLPDAHSKSKGKKHGSSQAGAPKQDGGEGIAIVIAAAFAQQQRQ